MSEVEQNTIRKLEAEIEKLKSDLILERVKRKQIVAELDKADSYIGHLEELLMDLDMNMDDEDDEDDEEDEL